MAERRAIFVLPAQEALRGPAMSFQAGHSGRITHKVSGLPPKAEIDPHFPPVPLAQTGSTPNMAMASAETTPTFAVRGVVDDDGDMPPVHAGETQVFSDPVIESFLAPGCAAGSIGTAADVAAALDVAGLAAKGLDGSGVALAMMDSGINLAHLAGKGLAPSLDPSLTWSPGHGKPGYYAVDHGTMCAFDALIAAPKATLLDFPILLSRTTTPGSAMAGFLSDALRAYSTLLGMMGRPEAERPFKSLVVNNSWGMYNLSWDFPAGHPGRYADNPGHPFNIVVGALARAGADILFAAGNCGADCPDGRCLGAVKGTIMGANAHPDVITIAGVTHLHRRVGYSSQGPITGMSHAKPDLASYTHFEGSEAFGPCRPDTGTSAACPVAAGCVAALRTRLAPMALPPRFMSRELRADALKRGSSTGWNKNYGYGIIRPAITAGRLGL